jgi:hypothetical protein
VRHRFDLETIVELPAPVANFDDAADAAAQYRRGSRSENTRRAYRSAVARLTDWCAAHGRAALPAAPETVAAFLAAEARAELAVNTLRLRHAAIRYMHLLGGYPPPTAAAVVSTTFAGIKRAHTAGQQKDRPGARSVAPRDPGDPGDIARAARLRPAARRLRRGAAAERDREARARARDTPRRRHRAVSAVAQATDPPYGVEYAYVWHPAGARQVEFYNSLDVEVLGSDFEATAALGTR